VVDGSTMAPLSLYWLLIWLSVGGAVDLSRLRSLTFAHPNAHPKPAEKQAPERFNHAKNNED